MSTIPVSAAIRIIPREVDFLDRNVGSRGEIFFDKDSNSLRLYDGDKKGGDIVLTPFNLSQNITNSGVATVTYNVTVGVDPHGIESGNKYFLNGVYKPAINMVIGYTYIFNQNDQTNVYYPNAQGGAVNQHPLNFSSDNANGELGGGTNYTTKVIYMLDNKVVNKTAYWERFSISTERSVQITITNDTPVTLYYWCQQHTGMGNTITIAEPGTGASGGASLEVSDEAPADPSNGDIWYNSTNAKLYVYVEDEDSFQWVQPVTPGPGSILDLGIADGTNGQILTTDGAGTFTFEDAPQGFDGAFSSLTGKPTTVAGYGITDALTSVPAQSFASLTGKPTTISGYGITDAQSALVSGTSIKTINGTSVLGSGNITISGGGGTPGGVDTQVQYNNNGAFAGDAGFTYNAGSDTLTITNIITESINAPNTLTGTYTISSPTTITLDPVDEIINDAPMKLVSKTVADLSTLVSSVGAMVFCTNESGGAIPAFYDGTNWRRVSDRAIVS